MDWSGLYSTFVTFGQSRDSILGYILQVGDGSWSKRKLAINIVADTTIALNGILAELVNIWRCWELYHKNWFVVGFPLAGVAGVSAIS
ncbi:hypothetical protein BDZ89DRAFT_1078783 [Hymenopellis radicata]|nr:hypothetical protein BDZ89DRAFT_1078783 [Hymenopellis radicata]